MKLHHPDSSLHKLAKTLRDRFIQRESSVMAAIALATDARLKNSHGIKWNVKPGSLFTGNPAVWCGKQLSGNDRAEIENIFCDRVVAGNLRRLHSEPLRRAMIEFKHIF